IIFFLEAILMSVAIMYPRRKKKYSDEVSEFVSSLDVDQNFVDAEILSGLVHVNALKEAGLVDEKEEASLKEALLEAHKKIKSGEFEFETGLEDIHPNVEKYVLEKCGITGGKLNTARSREDMIATDIRMASRKKIIDIEEKTIKLMETMMKKAWKYADVVMPIYSHQQHAQVGTFGHYIMSHVDAFIRDIERLESAYAAVNKCPLGSFEGGGTSFQLDRILIAEGLGFDGIIENTLDAVGSRDFLLEVTSSLAIAMNNISKLAGDLIRFSSFEYGIITVGSEYTTSTVSMPQRKNPYVMELIRGKTAEVYGNMSKVFMILKGLSSGYTRDLQEAHSMLFKSFEVVETSIDMLRKVIDSMSLNDAKALGICDKDFVCAADLVEMLVNKNIPYRNASAVVGTLLNECVKSKKRLSEIDAELVESIVLRQLKFEIKISDGDLKNAVIPEQVIVGRKTKGSPNPKEIKRMIANRESLINNKKKGIAKRQKVLKKVNSLLK
ncbi:argininosuccinate lyase, partial [Candidatus Undinarchaeota archaeon]